jgi:hypothetical protein
MSKTDVNLRFGTLRLEDDSVELVSTGFEKFTHNFINSGDLYSVISPSDQLLGIVPWKAVHSISTVSCKLSDYPSFAIIENAYSALVGATVNDEWVIQPGYIAESKLQRKKSRLVASLNTKTSVLILTGFSKNSLSIPLPVPPNQRFFSFDQPSKWKNPRKPYQRYFVSSDVTPNEFTRTDKHQLIHVRVEQWFSSYQHRVTQVNVVPLSSPEIRQSYTITGSPRHRYRGWYKYGFGTVHALPEPFNERSYYFYTYMVNKDITLDSYGKLKNRGDDEIVDTLTFFWKTLVGKECELVNGEIAYISFDFQIVTFDGQVISVTLKVEMSREFSVSKYEIDRCSKIK